MPINSFISYHFPTSWDEHVEVEIMHDLLHLVVEGARKTGSKIVVAGNFNACIGSLRVGEDTAGGGKWGLGPRNTGVDAIVSWVLANGFDVRNRQTSLHPARQSWTCQRMMDGAKVPQDNILADGQVPVQQVWHDYILPLGLVTYIAFYNDVAHVN